MYFCACTFICNVLIVKPVSRVLWDLYIFNYYVLSVVIGWPPIVPATVTTNLWRGIIKASGRHSRLCCSGLRRTILPPPPLHKNIGVVSGLEREGTVTRKVIKSQGLLYYVVTYSLGGAQVGVTPPQEVQSRYGRQQVHYEMIVHQVLGVQLQTLHVVLSEVRP